MDRWWNNTDRRRPKFGKTKWFILYNFVQNISHTDDRKLLWIEETNSNTGMEDWSVHKKKIVVQGD